MAKAGKPTPKRIAYLWGAGATHAEAQYLGTSLSLLMTDNDFFGDGIATRILRLLRSNDQASFRSDKGIDIEKLISLLAASGVEAHSQIADAMRAKYFTELKASLATTDILDNPNLAIRLLRMHGDPIFHEQVETLSGIITTNHDGLLQTAFHKVFERVNIGFDFTSPTFTDTNFNGVPPILQLHGSFTWRFGRPIRVAKLSINSQYANTVWIPPTILKESKNYPFNKLSALAYELLARRCDVLRVVGSSLTQNDWNILSLIFNAQRHLESTNGTAFLVELIMPHDSGQKIADECGFIRNLTPIGFLTEGRFSEYKDTKIPPKSDMANPLAYWLNQKLEFHSSRGELSTSLWKNRRSGSKERIDEAKGGRLDRRKAI